MRLTVFTLIILFNSLSGAAVGCSAVTNDDLCSPAAEANDQCVNIAAIIGNNPVDATEELDSSIDSD